MLMYAGGMRRAGSTVQFQMAKHIACNNGGFGVKFKQEREIEKWCKIESYAVIKSHFPEHRNRWDVSRTFAIRCYRDVRDCVVSYMLLHDYSFDFVMSEGVFQRSLMEDKAWSKALPESHVYVSRYEIWSDNWFTLAVEARNIAAFMGVGLSVMDSLMLAAFYTKQHNKARADKLTELDPDNYLIPGHVHSGTSQYKSMLTTSQILLLNGTFGHWLTSHGYGLT